MRASLLMISTLAAGWTLTSATSVNAGESPQYDFNIEQQPLSRALQEFARQSGMQIIFFSRGIEGYEVPALTGRFTASTALAQLLSGTELTFRELNPYTIEVIPKATPAPDVARNEAAQAPPPAAPVASSQADVRAQLDEIIVTAQKRVEVVQEIPVAVDVIKGDTLVQEGVRDLKDIGKTSTQLEVNTRVGQATIIGMRGMQQMGFSPTGDTLTAVHLDGAYLFNFWGLNGLLFDLDRVEVLAGPQGTLYGRNTAAGAVNLITRRPGKEFSVDGKLEFGNFGTQRYDVGIDLPFHDEIGMRFAGTKYRRDALYTDGSAAAAQWGARLSVVWTPTERDAFLVTYDHIDTGGTTESGGFIGLNEQVREYDRATNSFLSNPPASVINFQNLTGGDPYDNLAYYQRRGLQFVGAMESVHRGVMAQYTHEFSGFDLVLQYSKRRLEAISRTANKAASAYVSAQWPQLASSDVVELRFVSDSDGSLTWVGGLFWFDSHTLHGNATPNYPSPTATFSGFVNTATGPVSTLGTLPPDPNTGLDAPGCPCISGFYPINGEGTSYAAYGQLTWTPPASRRWHFTGGLRYTRDDKETLQGYHINGVLHSLWLPDANVPDYLVPSIITPAQAVPGVPATILHTDGKGSWDAIQWRLGMEYDVDASSMLYATLSTGYKSGGFAYGSTPRLKPEDLLAFEIGTKNRFFGNTLQFNASAWWYDYRNQEIQITRPISPPFPEINNIPQTTIATVGNVGRVNMAGVAFDLDWLATSVDRVGISATHIYSRVENGYETLDGMRNQIFNEGERLGDAPRWQILARYAHTWKFSSGATLVPSVKYQWQSAKYDASIIPAGSVAAGATAIDPSAGTYNLERRNPWQMRIPDQGILDLQLQFTAASKRWDIAAYVHNVTDQLEIKNIVYGNNPLSGGATQNYGHVTALLGEPRTWGVILGVHF